MSIRHPTQRSEAIGKRRGIIFASVVGTLLLAYILKLYSLQIVRGSEYQSRATQVAQRVVPIPAQRGEIFDRDATAPIVFNIDSFAVDVIPRELAQAEEYDVKERLSLVLGVSISDIEERLSSTRTSQIRPTEVAENVSKSAVFSIAENIDMYPGVTWRNNPIRNYIESGSISHVTGYVSDITTEELRVLYNQGYSSGDEIGQSGIERVYDDLLRGTEGAQYRTVDATGRLVNLPNERLIPPVNGSALFSRLISTCRNWSNELLEIEPDRQLY